MKLVILKNKKKPVRTTGFIFQYFKVHRQELTFGWALLQRYKPDRSDMFFRQR
tara:strand:+ start:109 stop:267 length:159 start_codon:yes stop_codon:yes gene_type:complete